MSSTTNSPGVSPVRQSKLTRGQRPGWLVPVIGLGAVVAGAAIAALVGFSIALWALFAAVIFLIAGPLAVGLIEGRRSGADSMMTFLVYGAFVLAVIPLVS
ncbi:phosphate ABC transporter permease, partial [Kocuria rhizophila]